jgi:Calcium binding
MGKDASKGRTSTTVAPKKRTGKVSTARLDEMIEEATVDCYNDSEQATGLFTMLEENLALPFTTVILGVEVTVQKVDTTEPDEIVAVCRRGRERHKVPILDLPLPEPRPEGSEWIDAYRRWGKGR